MRLLVVEDDTRLAERLRAELGRAGFAVDISHDGVEAEYLGEEGFYDVIVLDLGLPQRGGLEVLRRWRAHQNQTPVLILTARDAWHEKVDGFKAGADDYLAKPFHTEELIARIRAILRRQYGQAAAHLEAAGLRLDEERQSVTTSDQKTVELTGTEFRLLRYMMLHPGRILSKATLTEHVYDFDSDKDSNVIEVYINRLRQKLGRGLIRTRRGQGYILGDKDQ